MARARTRTAVASLDTHCLIVAVPKQGPAEVSSNLPRPVAASALRQLANALDTDRRPPAPLDPSNVRAALDFTSHEPDQVLAALRDVLLDTKPPRNPEQALAAARIILAAHAHQLAALVEADLAEARSRWGLTRSSRGLLTGYDNARRALHTYADRLAAEQALAESAANERAEP
ncbi:hypothetical protein BJP40_08430 [Streptomyces sp. CC53]|uniref:hypothetical protein n=1 Tax=Streptomyces sp. CC53 TaxID=1906740 RepID=UPI0008DCCAB2|nr:hypothetical protein [Streptomyces sp. CC53]OII60878.1 hypothetical protein BJP40_08430 [Streptomyces sp. CC53]